MYPCVDPCMCICIMCVCVCIYMCYENVSNAFELLIEVRISHAVVKTIVEDKLQRVLITVHKIIGGTHKKFMRN